MRAARDGDRSAFARLVELYGGQVLGAVRARLGTDEGAMDVVQETWVRVARGLRTFRDGADFRPWLFAVAFNALRDDARRAALRPVPMDDDGLDAGPSAFDPELVRVAEREAIESALARVPEPYRSAVYAVDVLDLDHPEAAAALDCPAGTLKSRLSRGRRIFCDHYLRSTAGQAQPSGAPTFDDPREQP